MSDDQVYRGERNIDGAEVLVGGRPLDPRFDIHTFTRRGYEWGYEGDGPLQLAVAILACHLGDDERASTECRAFMSRIVANFGNEWEMTSKDIDRALATIRSAH